MMVEAKSSDKNPRVSGWRPWGLLVPSSRADFTSMSHAAPRGVLSAVLGVWWL